LTSPLTFRVQDGDAGERLDRLVVRHATGIGRRRAAELFAAGAVRVDGRRAAKGELARAGSTVEVELGEPDRAAPEPEAALDVRHETEHLLVVHKPAGQPSVAVRGSDRGTLAGALAGHYPELTSIGSPREGGLVHRLDTGTSGLLVAARSATAYARLRETVRVGALQKRYLALVESADLPGSGVIDRPLVPDPRNAQKVSWEGPGLSRARFAVTNWRVVERGKRWALVEAEASPAVRHQIRAHLASIDHPIAGDLLYGGAQVPELAGRHALHASYVAWAGDDTLRGFAVEAPLPPELLALLVG
jgi:23S rRNA pseudouridine1911/1915/1917 synthase